LIERYQLLILSLIQAISRYLYNTLSNTTMMLSNMIGPMEKVAIHGNPIKSFSFFVTGLPQVSKQVTYIVPTIFLLLESKCSVHIYSGLYIIEEFVDVGAGSVYCELYGRCSGASSCSQGLCWRRYSCQLFQGSLRRNQTIPVWWQHLAVRAIL